MWAIGCIFAELLLRQSLFSTFACDGFNQLQDIFHTLGAPGMERCDIKYIATAKDLLNLKLPSPNKLPKLLSSVKSKEAHDLLSKLLCLNASDRLTAS
jgi:serine/threonine protein kinase